MIKHILTAASLAVVLSLTGCQPAIPAGNTEETQPAVETSASIKEESPAVPEETQAEPETMPETEAETQYDGPKSLKEENSTDYYNDIFMNGTEVLRLERRTMIVPIVMKDLLTAVKSHDISLYTTSYKEDSKNGTLLLVDEDTNLDEIGSTDNQYTLFINPSYTASTEKGMRDISSDYKLVLSTEETDFSTKTVGNLIVNGINITCDGKSDIFYRNTDLNSLSSVDAAKRLLNVEPEDWVEIRSGISVMNSFNDSVTISFEESDEENISINGISLLKNSDKPHRYMSESVLKR